MNFSVPFLVFLTAFIAVCGCQKHDGGQNQAAPEQRSASLTTAGSDSSKQNESIDLSDAVGKLAPEIKLESAFNGPPVEEIKLASLRGKVVVLDYWATW